MLSLWKTELLLLEKALLMDLDTESPVKPMEPMVLTTLTTSKSQIHDFYFTSSPDTLTQSVCHTKKSLKKRAIASSIFSINFTPSIHINMFNDNTTSTSTSCDQLLQQARKFLKLAYLQTKTTNQPKLATSIKAIDKVWKSEDLSSLATEEKNFSKEQQTVQQ